LLIIFEYRKNRVLLKQLPAKAGLVQQKKKLNWEGE
jgi:hypothetical protein